MTNFSPQHSVRFRSQEIATQILLYIEERGLRSGDKLPPERVLAERFRASRSCVRTAIRQLTEKKVLTSRQGSGTYLADMPERNEGPFPLKFFFNELSSPEHLFEFRKFLECSVADIAARHATAKDIATLKTIFYDQQRAMAEGRDESKYIESFHETLAKITGNPIFITLMAALNDALNSRRHTANEQKLLRRKSSHYWHHKIIKALEENSPEQCVLEMLKHIKSTVISSD